MGILKLKHGDCYYDDEDEDVVKKYPWYSKRGRNTYYVVTKPTIERKRIYISMHRLIMGKYYYEEIQGKLIDHDNRNGLDNRKSNLRISTTSQNGMNAKKRSDNTSGYKGVHWNKARKKWRAEIRINTKKTHLGLFDTPEEGHVAYCEAAKIHHGIFARFE